MRNTTRITNASIESAGLPKVPKQVIAEYIWNGFDAKASSISIDISSNILGFIEQIRISDDGEGIAPKLLQQSFGNFLDSLKKDGPKRTSYTRGKKGKGRFSFSLFASRATWLTVVEQDDQFYEYHISIDAANKAAYDYSEPKASRAKKTGTTVMLEGIFGLNNAVLESADFLDFLAQEFGWYLHLNQDKGYNIYINGQALAYAHIIEESESSPLTIYSPSEDSFQFQVDYIRWKFPIGDRYYYYFLDSAHTEVAKVLSSFNNNAIDFHHSVFVRSTFFDQFEQSDMTLANEGNLFSDKDQQVVYRKLMAELRDLMARKQKKYLREHAVDSKLQELVSKDLLPVYSEGAKDQQRKKTLLELIQELYMADPRAFVGIKADLVRSYFGFIDLLLQSNRKGDILPIIEQAMSLTDKERDRIKLLLA